MEGQSGEKSFRSRHPHLLLHRQMPPQLNFLGQNSISWGIFQGCPSGFHKISQELNSLRLCCDCPKDFLRDFPIKIPPEAIICKKMKDFLRDFPIKIPPEAKIFEIWKDALRDFLNKIPPEAEIFKIWKDFLRDYPIQIPPEAKTYKMEGFP